VNKTLREIVQAWVLTQQRPDLINMVIRIHNGEISILDNTQLLCNFLTVENLRQVGVSKGTATRVTGILRQIIDHYHLGKNGTYDLCTVEEFVEIFSNGGLLKTHYLGIKSYTALNVLLEKGGYKKL
jgi:hypothetical protein